MILCDTDSLIEFFKKNEIIVSALRDIGQERLAVSQITVAELYFGALNKIELARIRRDLAALHAYPVSVGISQRFLRETGQVFVVGWAQERSPTSGRTQGAEMLGFAHHPQPAELRGFRAWAESVELISGGGGAESPAVRGVRSPSSPGHPSESRPDSLTHSIPLHP